MARCSPSLSTLSPKTPSVRNFGISSTQAAVLSFLTLLQFGAHANLPHYVIRPHGVLLVKRKCASRHRCCRYLEAVSLFFLGTIWFSLSFTVSNSCFHVYTTEAFARAGSTRAYPTIRRMKKHELLSFDVVMYIHMHLPLEINKLR